MDECLDDVLTAIDGEANVFVVSDHGIGQQKEWSVALNTWLAEQGYAETTTDGEGSPGAEGSAPGGRARVLGALGALGLTKQRIERLLSTVGLCGVDTRLAPEGFGSALEEETVTHKRSRAFYEWMGSAASSSTTSASSPGER